MIRLGPTSPQRESMHDLAGEFGEEQYAVCSAHRQAESDGWVERPRDAEDLTPGTGARVFWQGGDLKGWLER